VGVRKKLTKKRKNTHLMGCAQMPSDAPRLGHGAFRQYDFDDLKVNLVSVVPAATIRCHAYNIQEDRHSCLSFSARHSQTRQPDKNVRPPGAWDFTVFLQIRSR